jgi:hypothetical protein
MNLLYSDLITKIFSYLEGKDVISCSMVNRLWYRSSSRNEMWYDLLQKENRKFLKSKWKFDENIDYKILYLRLFHQKYKIQTWNFYLEFPIPHYRTWWESLVWKLCFLYPMFVISFPIIVGVEIYEYWIHCNNRYQYCKCDSCFRKLSQVCKNI